MKKLALLVFMFCSLFAIAQQQNEDIIYLNDGSILRGKIIERRDDGGVKMIMNGGREIVISMKEVNK
ncbi:MAG: hypothetical protein IPN76_33065 [Saprospiraceae bacterium]|nr:hypothetical protein [Saprospiraceae bacterium]